MKILFVASGNKAVGQVNSFVRSQYDSLAKAGEQMLLFPVVGHGLKGYMSNLKALRQTIQKEEPDIIHAHYSTCGLLASIACCGVRYKSGNRPKVFVSLLGSFPKHNFKYRYVRFFIKHIWDGALVKSERTRSQLGLPLPVVPNGVNTNIFHPMEMSEARVKVGFETDKRYIVWCSNPSRPEKNWLLAEKAVDRLNAQRQEKNEKPVILVPVYDHTPEQVATYINAADCMLLTSDTEGSPNVIKESMACNCPIVTTDVGDVRERLTGLEGCYIVEDNNIRFSEINKAVPLVAASLQQALAFAKRTKGKERIEKDRLQIAAIARRIIQIYQQLC